MEAPVPEQGQSQVAGKPQVGSTAADHGHPADVQARVGPIGVYLLASHTEDAVWQLAQPDVAPRIIEYRRCPAGRVMVGRGAVPLPVTKMHESLADNAHPQA